MRNLGGEKNILPSWIHSSLEGGSRHKPVAFGREDES